jgi:hypothetical protein
MKTKRVDMYQIINKQKNKYNKFVILYVSRHNNIFEFTSYGASSLDEAIKAGYSKLEELKFDIYGYKYQKHTEYNNNSVAA